MVEVKMGRQNQAHVVGTQAPCAQLWSDLVVVFDNVREDRDRLPRTSEPTQSGKQQVAFS